MCDDYWNPEGRKGEAHTNHKLTQAQVEEIRARYIPYKVSRKALAKEYNVSPSTIERIVTNTGWKASTLPYETILRKYHPYTTVKRAS